MKRKMIDASNWGFLERYENTYFRSEDERYKGYVSVTKFEKVKDKLIVDYYDEEETVLIDDGFECVLFVPDDAFWCVSAVYDRNQNILEWYFDMIKSTGKTPDGIPYYDDLYLDLTVAPDGSFHILDEDELLEAVAVQDITQEDYDLAHRTCTEVMNTVALDQEFMQDFLSSYLNKRGCRKKA